MIISALHRFQSAGPALAIAAAMALSAAPAQAVVFKLIGKCTTISKPGFYKVTRNLKFAGADVCLRITADNVTLNVNKHTLTGSGGGIGMLIAGKNAFVDFNEGGISNFGIGLEDDGDDAVVENFGLQNDSDTGLYVNGANGSTFGGFGTGKNANHGIHLRLAGHNLFHNVGVGPNNGELGIWADQSSNNAFSNFQANSNGIAGVYFGCAATGPAGGGAGCSGSDSGSNVVLSAGVDNNGSYGIAIDLDSETNVISGAEQSGNPVDDAYDGNIGCGTNLWFNQNHPTENQSCTNE